ncbi:hypothetical protein TTY48_26320 [Tsukamurella sp. TY48]|nr:hypothetical protein TTY48_26320 [Tsukamurella sp. TY48]
MIFIPVLLALIPLIPMTIVTEMGGSGETIDEEVRWGAPWITRAEPDCSTPQSTWS